MDILQLFRIDPICKNLYNRRTVFPSGVSHIRPLFINTGSLDIVFQNNNIFFLNIPVLGH